MASSLTNLLYHIVFSTKERIPLIHEDLEETLYDYIGGILRGQRSILLEIGGMPDHVHLLVKLKADLRSRRRSTSSNRIPPAEPTGPSPPGRPSARAASLADYTSSSSCGKIYEMTVSRAAPPGRGSKGSLSDEA